MRPIKLSPGLARLLAPFAALLAVAVLSVPAIYWAERSSLAVWAKKTERFVPGRVGFRMAGVSAPAATPAAAANLADDEPVIGIEAGGKFRAYHEKAMSGKSRHVINDVLGGRAVTVTFCDLDDCARAFGGDEASAPLDVALAGLDEKGMLLGVGSVEYFQRTAEVAEPARDQPLPPFPYASYPLTRTTWGEWKSLHPDTDVFIHDAADAEMEKATK